MRLPTFLVRSSLVLLISGGVACGSSNEEESSLDAAVDAGVDAAQADAGAPDASLDAGVDADVDAGLDADVDAGSDAGVEDEDAGSDAGVEDEDAGSDAGMDASPCGNGTIDPEFGEVCDPAYSFPTNPEQTCTCPNDGDGCTDDLWVPDPTTGVCGGTCQHSPRSGHGINTCDDGNVCTFDQITGGSPATCDVVCMNPPIPDCP